MGMFHIKKSVMLRIEVHGVYIFQIDNGTGSALLQFGQSDFP
jgi:hypothetical protein